MKDIPPLWNYIQCTVLKQSGSRPDTGGNAREKRSVKARENIYTKLRRKKERLFCAVVVLSTSTAVWSGGRKKREIALHREELSGGNNILFWRFCWLVFLDTVMFETAGNGTEDAYNTNMLRRVHNTSF